MIFPNTSSICYVKYRNELLFIRIMIDARINFKKEKKKKRKRKTRNICSSNTIVHNVSSFFFFFSIVKFNFSSFSVLLLQKFVILSSICYVKYQSEL